VAVENGVFHNQNVTDYPDGGAREAAQSERS
jgi:hypothetical protein